MFKIKSPQTQVQSIQYTGEKHGLDKDQNYVLVYEYNEDGDLKHEDLALIFDQANKKIFMGGYCCLYIMHNAYFLYLVCATQRRMCGCYKLILINISSPKAPRS
jgi:hypothetical protein